MTRGRAVAVITAALLCGAGTAMLASATNHEDAKLVWAVFGSVVGWSFIGTGLYAWWRRPESRVGALMVLLGFAWFLNALSLANAELPYSFAQIVSGLWGAVFLHLIITFPSGRLARGIDRAIVIAGYVIFTVGSVPALLVATPHELGCDECPTTVFFIQHDHTLATIALGVQAALYVVLFVIVLVRLTLRWRRTGPLERLQLTPVYACGLVTFLLVTVGTAGAGTPALWAAVIATALLPFAFLAGLLRSHVARLDSELRARLQDLRASRARLVQASDTERRRLERDLHDGAQARLVGVTLLLAHARRRVAERSELATTLDRAVDELKTSLAELRELARGIHPAVLTDQGLERAVTALAARAPVPVTIDADDGERLPAAVEIAAYYVVSEALQNVAKYAQATHAGVAIRRVEGRVIVDVTDNGIGGADAGQGSGLAGLADRLGALDGTIAVDSPPGHGTRLHAEIPYGLVAEPS
jgi:signal transduction histidine kinase